jgi:hypothetical protein
MPLYKMLHKADGFQRDKQADKEFLEVKKYLKRIPTLVLPTTLQNFKFWNLTKFH